MPTEFWNSWALWEKMCFVLGCAIVAVMGLGCVKLVYNHWRLRKYIAVAASKREQTQEIKRVASVKRRKGQDVPFGIRAIESGIEVDGVWISKSNTPVISVTGSPPSSVEFEPCASTTVHSVHGLPSTSSIPQLEIPQPAHGYPGASSSRFSPSFRDPSQHSEYAGSVESVYDWRSSAGSNTAPQGRQTPNPRGSSHLTPSNPYMFRNSATLAALEGRELATKASIKSPEVRFEQVNNSEAISQSSIQSRSSQGHYVPKRSEQVRHSSAVPLGATYLSTVDARPFTEDHKGDLNSLASHRRSHAAEIGQLQPRGRISTASGDWTPSTALLSQQPGLRSDGFADRDPPLPDEADNPFTTPLLTPVHDIINEAPSFEAFIAANTVNVPDESISSIDSSEEVERIGDVQPLQMTDSNRQSQRAQVIRKVNSGFEILRPGTLEKSRQSNDSADLRQSLETEQKRQGKRLQKKRRESTKGKVSEFSENV